MSGYIKKQLQKYKHEKPTKPQHSTYTVSPKRYGKVAHDPTPEDETPLLEKEGRTHVVYIFQ